MVVKQALALTAPGPWILVAKLEPHGDTDTSFAGNAPDVVDQAILFYMHLQTRKAAA